MPQRFISGMDCAAYSGGEGGRFMHRLMVEWLTQVVGWPAHDLIGSTWDNVAGSGSVAETTTVKVIEITSPSYVFSTSNENWYLTLTGFTSPYEARDGIYRIRKFLGAVGDVYTLEIYQNQGVHSDGFPVGHTGLNWRLWAANDTYCPTSTADVAVLTGRGKTGAGLGDAQGTGDSFSLAGTTITFTDAGATFQDHDVGKDIVIEGATTPGNDGTFVITSRISATQITYENASGATEAYSGTWKIRYDFHVYMQCDSWDYGYGGLRASPWASWDNVTHNWAAGDNRYTSLVYPTGGTGGMPGWMHRPIIWAEADEDHFTFTVLALQIDGNYSIWMHYSAGEFDPFYPEYDARPVWVNVGNDNGGFYIYQNELPIIGYHSNVHNISFYYGVKGLAYDDTTTLTYYQMIPHVPSSANYNWVSNSRRKLSSYSRQAYRIPIIAESRTSGFMELRGTIRNYWYCNQTLPLQYPLGANGEFMHPIGGIMIPWNGAKSAFPAGRSQVG